MLGLVSIMIAKIDYLSASSASSDRLKHNGGGGILEIDKGVPVFLRNRLHRTSLAIKGRQGQIVVPVATLNHEKYYLFPVLCIGRAIRNKRPKSKSLPYGGTKQLWARSKLTQVNSFAKGPPATS